MLLPLVLRVIDAPLGDRAKFVASRAAFCSRFDPTLPVVKLWHDLCATQSDPNRQSVALLLIGSEHAELYN